MNKSDYKKALVEVRNNYIDLDKKLDEEMTAKKVQMENNIVNYLNRKSFSLISNKNLFLQYLGVVIVYKVLRKKTVNDITEMIKDDYDDYFLTYMQKKELNSQFGNISNAISFIDSISQEQLDKYLSYKIN